MRYYSTRNRNEAVNFAAAVLRGIAPDGGLYIPAEIPAFSAAVKRSLGTMTYREVAAETMRPFVKDSIPDAVLGDIVEDAYTFDAPLVNVPCALRDYTVLELFHGPTAAFKDFGARFMARAFAYFRRNADKKLDILVATSGDTGGAVADGFFGVDGIHVTVLYPKGRVSPLQERQIAGLDDGTERCNVTAIAVEGSFDDCQALVKAAFADAELRKKRELSSANSINIARLVPQAVYYAAAAGRYAAERGRAGIFSVPSGNFGNLTAGMYARAMGAPIERFIAATNINKTVPDYLEKGVYEPRESRATLSNAMDVGSPSNFERMKTQWTVDELRAQLQGEWTTDDETRAAIKEVFGAAHYCLDPHGAVAWSGAVKAGLAEAVCLETAHPAKFAETVEPLVGPPPPSPVLARVMERSVHSVTIPNDLSALKEVLSPA